MTARRAPSLAWRLTVAIAGVSLLVVGFSVVLIIVVTTYDLNQATARRAQSITTSLAAAARVAYATSQGWKSADLATLVALARSDNVWVQVLDATGTVVGEGGAPPTGPTQTPEHLVLTSGGQVVGQLVITLPTSNVSPAATWLRTRLALGAVVVGLLALALGVAVAVFVARRISRPVDALSRAVHEMNNGNLEARVGDLRTARELRELGRDFDQMADTLERQEQLRTGLAADVAHELRTPVAVLRASGEAVMDGVTPASREVVASMLEEVTRLGQRIADLELLTEAAATRVRLAREEIDLAQVTGAACEAARPRFSQAGVALHTDLVPAPVLGDPRRLHQVVTNLLVNAAKFTPSGGTVRVTLSRLDRHVLLKVADTGVGIEPAELPRVFERFWQGAGSAGSGGSGVGLAIVAELVQAHGGTVSVESQVGRGTEFLVRLPLAPDHEPEG